MANITDELALRAEETPFGVAVIDRDRLFHYRQLDRIVWRAAAWLRGQGIAPGMVVGITIDTAFTHLLVALALARMGAVQIALPPGEPLPVLRDLARRAGVVRIVGGGRVAASLGLPHLVPQSAWLVADETPIDPSLRAPGGDRPWSIVTSSGSTGRPKLILFSHAKEILRRERVEPDLGLLPGERLLSLVAMAFGAGKRFQLGCLIRGRTLVLDSQAFPPAVPALFQTIERHRVRALVTTPFQLEQILAHCPEDAPRLPDLRTVWAGSATLTERLRAEVRRRLAPNLVVTYSTNEVGQLACAHPATWLRHPGTVGHPVPGVRARVTDEAGRVLPAGAIGRLGLRGPGMEAVYLDDPVASAAANRDGWYEPGDLAALAEDGAILFHGRADDLINCDGIKVAPAEIERVFLGHADVAEAVALALPDPRHGQLPAVALVLRRPQAATALEAHGRERLGPRAPRLVLVTGALPRNGMGKVDRQALVERFTTLSGNRIGDA